MNDLKKFKSTKFNLYDQINYKIWAKLYTLIVIISFHIIWLFYTFILNYDDTSLIYGFQPVLIVPYIVYCIIDLKKEDKDDITPLSTRINRFLNYVMTIYFIVVIVIIIIPNKYKNAFVLVIKDVNKYFVKEFKTKVLQV
jgi:hypothetical protein